jgi:uncharacterized membrane protein YphA (DoxX/SURF4 family)
MLPLTDEGWTARARKAVLLVRILVGWVFLSEGLQKFSSRMPWELDAL